MKKTSKFFFISLCLSYPVAFHWTCFFTLCKETFGLCEFHTCQRAASGKTMYQNLIIKKHICLNLLLQMK
jgi:hypothetical protein